MPRVREIRMSRTDERNLLGEAEEAIEKIRCLQRDTSLLLIFF